MRRPSLLALAFLGGAACAGRPAPAAAQEKVPLDSIARLPGANVERDTTPLLTAARIARLSAPERVAWQAYLRRSRALGARDRAVMAAELRTLGRAAMVRAPYTHEFGVAPHMAGAWFASDSARALARNLLSWQTPAGGWSKHVPMRLRPRQPGESWYSENDQWRYIGTFDNDATVTQLRILGGVAAALEGKGSSNPNPNPGAQRRNPNPAVPERGPAANERQRTDSDSAGLRRLDSDSDSEQLETAFLRGLRYIADAQYPNGCFPQVYPLQGGYHDAATYNDNATVNILRLLRDVAGGHYAFVPAPERRRAGLEFQRGLRCILASQVVVNGERTVWGQQHDPLSLAPAPARSYELAGLCGRESAWILDFLMELPEPSPRIVGAVHAGVAWFRAHEIHDSIYDDGLLKPSPGAPPLWARNSEPATGRPFFANRDGVKLYDTARLTDRRYGYGWFGTEPAATLHTYESWVRQHPPAKGSNR